MWTSLACECGALMAGKCLVVVLTGAVCACLLGMEIAVIILVPLTMMTARVMMTMIMIVTIFNFAGPSITDSL